MPHITKYSEKMKCVKPKAWRTTWDEDLKLKYVRPVADQAVRALQVPPQFYDIVKSLPTTYSKFTVEDKRTVFDLIEDIISDTLVSGLDDKFFGEFVDIKEVPYGRYNSDTDN